MRRHSDIERAVISCVERGLADSDWRGLLYVMGWGTLADFRPLYIGKTGRLGRGTAINANLKTIRSNYSKFARWGDDRYRHIGGLSQALFDDDGSQPVPEKYRCWVETLFVERTLPQLRRDTTLMLIPWSERSVAPSGRPAVLQNAEDELIQLAATDFPDLLLNVKGEGQVVPDRTSWAALSLTGITRLRTLVSDAKQLAGAVSLIERCPVRARESCQQL